MSLDSCAIQDRLSQRTKGSDSTESQPLGPGVWVRRLWCFLAASPHRQAVRIYSHSFPSPRNCQLSSTFPGVTVHSAADTANRLGMGGRCSLQRRLSLTTTPGGKPLRQPCCADAASDHQALCSTVISQVQRVRDSDGAPMPSIHSSPGGSGRWGRTLPHGERGRQEPNKRRELNFQERTQGRAWEGKLDHVLGRKPCRRAGVCSRVHRRGLTPQRGERGP